MFKDSQGKAAPTAKKVWRISKNAPQGEWVEVKPALPAAVRKEVKPALPSPPVRDNELPEVSSGSWVTSSYDLLSGSQVIEDPETVPGDLFDELFAPVRDAPKGAG